MNCSRRILVQCAQPPLHLNATCTPLIAAVVSCQKPVVDALLQVSLFFPPFVCVMLRKMPGYAASMVCRASSHSFAVRKNTDCKEKRSGAKGRSSRNVCCRKGSSSTSSKILPVSPTIVRAGHRTNAAARWGLSKPFQHRILPSLTYAMSIIGTHRPAHC